MFEQYDFENKCAEVMLDNGLTPPTPFIMDGKLHRCGTVDKPHGNDGAYIAHGADMGTNSAPTLWWQNHKTGASNTFTGRRPQGQGMGAKHATQQGMGASQTTQQRMAQNQQREAERMAQIQQREAEQNAAYAEAAEKARAIWANGRPADDHLYLFNKNVKANGLRETEDGRLIVPVQAVNAEGATVIQSVQFIGADGQKRFLAGGKKAGGFFPIKATKEGSDVLCICEGYATGASINMATGHYCLVAFDAGNLLAAAKVLRAQCPNWNIVVCADNDVKTISASGGNDISGLGRNDISASGGNDVSVLGGNKISASGSYDINVSGNETSSESCGQTINSSGNNDVNSSGYNDINPSCYEAANLSGGKTINPSGGQTLTPLYNQTINNNVGITKALEAALAINAKIAIPPAHEGRATDFNDLHQARGLTAVAVCIDAAMPASDYANILAHANNAAMPASDNANLLAHANNAAMPASDYANLLAHANNAAMPASDNANLLAHANLLSQRPSGASGTPISPSTPIPSTQIGKIGEIGGGCAQKAYPLRKKTSPQTPYPVEALGEYADAVLAIAEHAGAPLSMVGNSVLSMLSLAAQDIAVIEHEGRTVLPSLYLLSILGSGERKSSVNDIVMEAIDAHQESITMEYNEKMKEWRIDDHAYNAAKIRASKGKDYATIRNQLKELGDAPARPVEPRLKITNTNIEGLYRMFQEGSDSLGLIADEGGILFGGTAFSSENKLKTIATLSSLWSSGSSDKVRMGEGSSYVRNKRLTCHIMVQPVVIEDFFADRVMQDQGFLPRFLITWPESLKGTRFKTLGKKTPIGQHPAVRKMHQDCLRLLQFPRAIDGYGKRRYIDLPLSAEAEAVYIDLYNRVEAAQAPDGELCEVANFASRTAEQALRIAGILTMAKDPRAAVVDGDVMQRAASLSTWYTHEAKRIMEQSGAKPEVLQAEALLRWFASRELTLTTQAFISQNTKFRSVVELKKILILLEEHGYVAAMPRGTIVNGKPSDKAWKVLHYAAQE